jgi:hypothetical protein
MYFRGNKSWERNGFRKIEETLHRTWIPGNLRILCIFNNYLCCCHFLTKKISSHLRCWHRKVISDLLAPTNFPFFCFCTRCQCRCSSPLVLVVEHRNHTTRSRIVQFWIFPAKKFSSIHAGNGVEQQQTAMDRVTRLGNFLPIGCLLKINGDRIKQWKHYQKVNLN